MTARYIVADVYEGLASLPDNSVDMVLTSPPFLALRSYLPADHPDKAKELGSEPTPAAFIDALLDVVEALDRVLAPHGSICIELGDTYAGSKPGGVAEYGELDERGQMNAWKPNAYGSATITRGHGSGEPKTGNGWPLAKSLCLIPESFRWALVYGRNPFNGRETPQWRARNVVRWHRPNPPVGALGDKFRPATSEMVIACKSGKRYFDLDAVRSESSPNTHARTAKGVDNRDNFGKSADRGGNWSTLPILHDSAGAPPLDTWIIPTEPYPGSHYATFPSALCVKPIKAMCPEKVCRTCGEPSRRIVGEAEYFNNSGKPARMDMNQPRRAEHVRQFDGTGDNSAHKVAPTLGWTDCGHADYRPGVVLDCFAGSGTTLSVATGHGRDAIGLDIDSRNADLAVDRIGPLLCTVETLTEGVA